MHSQQPVDRVPVRRRLWVTRDGATAQSEIVYCEPSGGSVPLSRCTACPFGGPTARDLAGRASTVECSRSSLGSTGTAPDPPPSGVRLRGSGVAQVAAMLPLGLCLVRPAVCVAYDAPLGVAARALGLETSAFGVSVVDERQRIVGVLTRARAALVSTHAGSDPTAAHMTSQWCSVAEGESLGVAFAAMTARQLRELAVVDYDRTFVGIVRDIDALLFVSHVARTGQRPPLDRAA